MPEVTKAQRTNVVDAIVAELKRAKAGLVLTPDEAALLERVTDGALKLAIDSAAVDQSDAKAVAAIGRRKANVEAQLASIEAFGVAKAQSKFWATVDAVIARLMAFTVTGLVAAV